MANANNLVVISDQMIRSMMRDPRFTKEFPCLNEVRRKLDNIASPNCKRCQKAKAKERANAIKLGKNCLATAPAPKRRVLKKLLSTNKVRVVRVNSKGGSIRVTF